MTPPSKESLKTARLALAAIGDLRSDGKTATLDTVSEHIQNEFAVPNRNLSKYLNKAIEKGVAFGAIKKMNGKLYLGNVMEGIREHRRRRRRSKGGRRRRRRKRSKCYV